MNARAAAWVAWPLWAVCVALVAIAWLLDLPGFWEMLFGVLVLTYSTVGAFVASRRPENPIGWIFCGAGLFVVFAFFLRVYAANPLALGVGRVVIVEYFAWLFDELMLVVLALATVLLLLLFPNGRLPSGLLFPEGRLPSRSWQAVVWMAVGGSGMIALAVVIQSSGAAFNNPLYIGGSLGDTLGALWGTGSFLLFVSALFAAISLVSRLTLSRGEERQQLKWFAYAAAMILSGFLLATFFGSASDLMWNVGSLVGILGFLFFPVATAIAILKHRLYDIDRIINRTLVYGGVTVTLIALYFGSIVLLQRVFVLVTDEKSTLAVVISTLVIAALFNPLRSRIQSLIDRRFYLRKYDARKTLDAFSATLRDETNLEALNAELVGVVKGTMQPAHVSLWLRPNVTPKGHQGG